MSAISIDQLAKENEELRQKLAELEAEISAIRRGEVDAVLVEGVREQVFTLEPPHAPYRLVVAQMPQAAATVAPDGKVMACNALFGDLLKRPLANLIGSRVQDLVHADCGERVERWLEDGQDGEADVVLELLRGDGSAVTTHLTARPLSEGALGKALVVVDVTQERQYEELLRAQDALRESEKRKDEFMATLAHELRNPLAPVRNAVQILALKMPDEPQLQWARDVIDRQVEVMARLLDDLLDVSRVGLLKPDLQRQILDLSGVVQAAVETSQPLIEAAGHELSVTLPEEPIRVDGDRVRLAQVFGNLLNNAAQYTEGNGRIELSIERRGGEAVVSVKDNGVGLEPDLLPHIFELFSRSKTELVRARGGLGIGLSLVKALVEQHGGTVEARSEGSGAGSEFVVRLPVVENAPAKGSRRAPGPPPGSRRRILVVDDNRDNADTLTVLLRLWGHEVVTTYGGQQALDMGASFHPQAVFLDIGMPALDGYEVCRRMREEAWGRSAFIVALTGLGQEDDRRRSRDAGFDDHLTKPVTTGALTRLLETFEGRIEVDEGHARA